MSFDFDAEMEALEDFVNEHFSPPPPYVSQLGPAIHTLIHRARIFLIESGLTEADVDGMELEKMMPEAILNALKRAHLKVQLEDELSQK